MERGDSELSRMIEQEVARKQKREASKVSREAQAAEARAAELSRESLRKEAQGIVCLRMREDAREAARYLREQGVQPDFTLQMSTGTRGLFRQVETIASMDVWVVRRNISPRKPGPRVDPDMDARNTYLHRSDPYSHDVRGIALDRRGDLLTYYYPTNLYTPYDPHSRQTLEENVDAMTVGRGHYGPAADSDLMPLEKISTEDQELNDRALHNFRARLAGVVARYL